MSLISWFGELYCDDLCETAGGKGASLCSLFQNEFPVAEGFVVCADAFRQFMSENGLWKEVYDQLDRIDWESSCSLSDTGSAIRDKIVNATLSDTLIQELSDNYRRLGENVPVAVRSSGTAEDLDDASFAGQQETFLYVIGEEDLKQYVKECWASLYNDCAIFYRKEKGFNEREIAIAVVVQKMVNSEKAGVLFSANPINKSLEVVMIEATWGLGEGLVQGIVNPDNYIIHKESYEMTTRYIADKEIMIVRESKEGGVKMTRVPRHLVAAPVLTDDECRDLVDLAVKAEQFYGKPQDIEWAIEGDCLYLLQSRPITTL